MAAMRQWIKPKQFPRRASYWPRMTSLAPSVTMPQEQTTRRQQVRWFAAKKKAKKEAVKGATSDSGKDSALAMALSQIEKTYGKGSIMQLGSRGKMNDVEVISTGSLSVDLALGIGGLPRGRVVEIFGPESSGKTTLALHVIAEAQKQGLNATFIDVEHAIDSSYAKNLGVDIDKLYLSQPDAGEDALEITDTLVRSGAMDVVVVDSVAALVPKAEIQGDMGDHHMALQARLMSQALRKLTSSLAKSKTLIIFVNQIRSKVGVLFGSPDVTSGGNALKFYSSVRMEIRRTGQIKEGTDIVGNTTRVKVIKNKLAPPFRQGEFDMTFGHGISKVGELVDMGVLFGALTKSGAWLYFHDQKEPFAQGKEKAKAYLEDNPDVAQKLEEEIRKRMTDIDEETEEAIVEATLSTSQLDTRAHGEFGIETAVENEEVDTLNEEEEKEVEDNIDTLDLDDTMDDDIDEPESPKK